MNADTQARDLQVGKRGNRRQWRLAVVVVLGTAILIAYAFLRRPAVTSLDAGDIRQVEVRFEPWGDDGAIAPGSNSSDPEVITGLIEVLRSGVETQDHKCGSRGVIRLKRSFGRPVELRFLPGHDEKWYEFRYGEKVYRVPRAEFVAAMERVGVAVPHECQ